MMRLTRGIVALSTFVCLILPSLVLAQSSVVYTNINNFSGIVQTIPSHLVDSGVALDGKNFRTDGNGALVKSLGSIPLSTPSGFGTLSNPTMLGDCDPLAVDSPRILYQCLNITSPTYGESGQHVLACDLADTGTSDGVVLAGNISWHQMDVPDELGVDLGYLDGFVDKAEAGGVNYLTCDTGILCIGRDQGSASYSDPTTCEWLGTPTRPTAVTSTEAGNLDGDYQWKVTYVSPLGESLPSKPSAQITLVTSQATVTIPLGPSNTTARKIYRNKGQISLTNGDFESGDMTGWTTTGSGATAVTTQDVSTVLDGLEAVGNWELGLGGSPSQSSVQKTQGSYALRWQGPLSTIDPNFTDYGTCFNDTDSWTNNHYETLKIDFYADPAAVFYQVQFTVAYDGSNRTSTYNAASLSSGWNELELDLTSYSYDNPIAEVYVTHYQDGTNEYVYIDNFRGATDNVYADTYACKLTRNGTDCRISQNWDGTSYQGNSVVLTGWVKTYYSSSVRIGVYDDGDTSTTYSSYHTGGGDWEQLTVTASMDASASTACQVRLEKATSDGYALFDEVVLSPGSTGFGDYYYVTTVSDNTTTSYTDNTSDTALGEALSTDGAFVPNGEWITYHNERLWSIGESQKTTQRQILWYSDDGDFDHWPDENYIEVGNNDGDPATGLVTFREVLYIFRRNSIWRLRGSSTDDFELKRVVSNIGCTDGRTIAVSDSNIYFYGGDNIWTFDGYNIVPKGSTINGETGVLADVYIDSDSSKFQASATYRNDEYILAYKTSISQDYAPYTLKYNQGSSIWTKISNGAYPTFWHNPKTLSGSTIAVSWDGVIWDMESYGHGVGYPSQTMQWRSVAMPLNAYIWKSKVDRIIVTVESDFVDTGDAYTLKFYRDPTTAEMVNGTETATSSKSYSLTTGINVLDWKLPASGITNRVMNTICVEINEAATADDEDDISKTPPRVIDLTIQHRPQPRTTN